MHKRHPLRFLKKILIELKSEPKVAPGRFCLSNGAIFFKAHCLKNQGGPAAQSTSLIIVVDRRCSCGNGVVKGQIISE